MKQLPEDFKQMMIESLGEAEYESLAEGIGGAVSTSVRINPRKSNSEELEYMLKEAETVGWCDNAYYLRERPQFTFDPLLHAGCYYVQEASSMYISQLLSHYCELVNTEKGMEKDAPLVVLDACAAPGGKSTLALSTLPHDSLLVANEYVRQRSQVLAENLTKWGNPNFIVTNSDTSDFCALGPVFDIIICDAPCSGEGMFRKDEKAIDEWSMNNVRVCQERQREILRNLWQCLREGGVLIYSTCTFNHFEDEDNVKWIVDELKGEELPLVNTDGMNIPHGHFYPHKTKGEGFFVSVFRKKEADDDEQDAPRRSKKNKKEQKGKSKQSKIPKEISNWISGKEEFSISEQSEGTYTAFPSIHASMLSSVAQSAKVVHYGIQLATVKGKGLQPSHSLAMSCNANLSAFPKAEVDYDQAIAYLRTETLTLPSDVPLGYIIITYKGHPLGFVKNIGNRANNLYPSEWRIRR